jgi:hypothetical protein
MDMKQLKRYLGIRLMILSKTFPLPKVGFLRGGLRIFIQFPRGITYD